LISFAALVLVIETLLAGHHAEPYRELWTVGGRIVLYAPVLVLGMGICSWFGHPFSPTLGSLLQLYAVAIAPGAFGALARFAAGTSAGNIVSVIVFLVLIGYFFSDEPVNGLIAIFLVLAAHHVVSMILAIVSGWFQYGL
jgi:hypothetical protein